MTYVIIYEKGTRPAIIYLHPGYSLDLIKTFPDSVQIVYLYPENTLKQIQAIPGTITRVELLPQHFISNMRMI